MRAAAGGVSMTARAAAAAASSTATRHRQAQAPVGAYGCERRELPRDLATTGRTDRRRCARRADQDLEPFFALLAGILVHWHGWCSTNSLARLQPDSKNGPRA